VGVAWSAQRIPTAVNLGFLDRSRYFFIQVAHQLSSRGWVDRVYHIKTNVNFLVANTRSRGWRNKIHRNRRYSCSPRQQKFCTRGIQACPLSEAKPAVFNKTKWSSCLIKQYAMKTYGWMKVFVTSALDGGGDLNAEAASTQGYGNPTASGRGSEFPDRLALSK
jgi:hypothetical protein